VMGPDGNWVEVQIRSRHMDDIAERGFAAHWKYKIGEGEEESELAVWLQTIEDILKNPEPNALDFLDTIKLNLFSSEIAVFTPKGELMTLPKDASVLDVAFTLHTDLGTHCIAGKVNHKLVPLSHKLSSGDQVEVLTSHSQRPKPEWEKFLVTAKGKTRLRAALRHERRQVMEKGEARLKEFLTQHEVEQKPEVLTRIISQTQVANKEELFYMIGNDEIVLNEQLLKKKGQGTGGLLNKWLRNPFKGNKDNKDNAAADDKQEAAAPGAPIDTRAVYKLKTAGGVSNYHLASCCHPIPGDDVVGFLNEDNTVVVHKMDCPTLARLKASYGSRLLQTQWEEHTEKFLTSIHIEGIDHQGILQQIVYLISTNMAIDMKRMNVTSDQGVFQCDLDVLITDTSVVTTLCRHLKRIKGVNSATRVS